MTTQLCNHLWSSIKDMSFKSKGHLSKVKSTSCHLCKTSKSTVLLPPCHETILLGACNGNSITVASWPNSKSSP